MPTATDSSSGAANFRRVVAAEVVSNFGSMMSRLAISWLGVLVLGATPFEMGLLAIADVLAGAMAALWLGVLVDRLRKRPVMVAADMARAALLGLLAVAAASAHLSFTGLLLAAAASGVLTLAFELARSAWMAQASTVDGLSRRNAQLAAGGAISEALAFGVTGALFQWVGGVLALAIDAASYLVSALLVRGVGEPAQDTPSAVASNRTANSITEVREALAILASQRGLRTLAVLEVFVSAALGIGSTSYMIYVSRDLAIPTGALGLVFATGGVGSTLGAVLAPRIGRSAGTGRALAWSLVCLAAGSIAIPLATGAGWLAVALLVAQQVVGDAGHVAYSIHDRTLRQTLAPSGALARMDAAIRTFGQLALVAGALSGGWIATIHGARMGLWLSAGFITSAAAVASITFARTARSKPEFSGIQ